MIISDEIFFLLIININVKNFSRHSIVWWQVKTGWLLSHGCGKLSVSWLWYARNDHIHFIHSESEQASMNRLNMILWMSNIQLIASKSPVHVLNYLSFWLVDWYVSHVRLDVQQELELNTQQVAVRFTSESADAVTCWDEHSRRIDSNCDYFFDQGSGQIIRLF